MLQRTSQWANFLSRVTIRATLLPSFFHDLPYTTVRTWYNVVLPMWTRAMPHGATFCRVSIDPTSTDSSTIAKKYQVYSARSISTFYVPPLRLARHVCHCEPHVAFLLSLTVPKDLCIVSNGRGENQEERLMPLEV